MEYTAEQRNENFRKMIGFLEADLAIKRILADLVPKSIDTFNSDSMIEYSDKRHEAVRDIEFYFDKMAELSGSKDEIKRKVKEIMSKIEQSGFSEGEIKKTYQECFSNMSKEFIETVNDKCVGYLVKNARNNSTIIQQSKTFNELLHFLHSYVTNNEEILESMPIVDQKEGKLGDYTLYGEDSKEGRMIFDSIQPDNTKMGYTQILSLRNKIIMMVRDAGHALSIEIDTSEEKPIVNYFIPKITNSKLVNQLRGVRRVDDSQQTTSGVFEIDNIEELGKAIIEFVEKVPQDSDMFIEGGLFYKPEEKKEGTVTEITEEEWEERLKNMHQKSNETRNTPEMQSFFSKLKSKIIGNKNKDDSIEK